MIYLGEIAIPISVVRGVSGHNGASWPALEVIQGKPRRQFLGASSGEVTVSLFLHAALVPPEPMLAALQLLSASGEMFDVVTSWGRRLGTYVLSSVDSRIVWAPKGTPIVISCELALDDPGVELPTVPSRPAAVRGYAGPTTTGEPSEDLSRSPGDVSLSEVARR